MSDFAYISICVIAGLGIALQAASNAALGRATTLPSFATFMSFLLGLVPIFIYYVIESRGFKGGTFVNLKWWYFLGGFLGAFYVFTVLWTVPKLGATVVLSATIVGQVFLSFFIDHFGLLEVHHTPLTVWRLTGTGLIIFGAIVLGIGEFI